MRTITLTKHIDPHTFTPMWTFEFDDGNKVEFALEIRQDASSAGKVFESFDLGLRGQVPDITDTEIEVIKALIKA